MAEPDPPRATFPRWLVVLLAGAAALYLLWLLRSVLTPVFFAALIAYMLDPVVDRLEHKKIPRAGAITIVLLALAVVLTLLVLLVVPSVVREIGQFASELPDQIGRLWQRVEPWLRAQGIETPHSVKEAYAGLGIDAKAVAGKAAAPVGEIVSWVLGGTATVLGAIANALLIPVFAFYLLYDWDRMVAAIRDLVPQRWRKPVSEMARDIDDVLGEFVRGQLIVMLILTVLYSVAYSLLGVRLAVPIGIVAGFLSFIPYVGGASAVGLALLMCALTGTTWTQVGGVVAAYAAIQALEGFVITPRIMEEKIGLGAVWVLLALMVFGELFGFLGVLLAVPAAAVCKIIIQRAVLHYRRSALYTTGGPPPASTRGSLIAGILTTDVTPDEPDPPSD